MPWHIARDDGSLLVSIAPPATDGSQLLERVRSEIDAGGVMSVTMPVSLDGGHHDGDVAVLESLWEMLTSLGVTILRPL
jgi:hypothetical protein